MKYIILTLFLALLLWMVAEALLQPGAQDLKAGFQELAFVRNEQNTGPVIRVYAVSVKDTLWGDMRQYGDYMPHTKYGHTTVYFFLDHQPAPTELFLGQDPMDNQYKSYCIGSYEKNAMGQTTFSRYPFAQ